MSKKSKNKITSDQLKKDKKDKAEEKKKASTTELYLHCRGHATMALSKLHGSGFDGVAAFERLSRSVDRIHDNDTNEIEAMLITQAKSLEYVFYDALSKLPSSNIEHAEVFANIALRSQNGCRRTLMALAELKHPRRTTTFIKQQNNHAVNQQVNNGVESTNKEFKKSEKIANELIAKEPNGSETMDIGTTIEAITGHSAPEAVGAINGTTNRPRQDD